MAELPTYFNDFMKTIRPQQHHVDDYRAGRDTLRKRLLEDQDLAPIIVSTFLQGSIRRSTALRPKGEERADVDLVVVTKLDKDDYPDPQDAMEVFVPFLKRYYNGKWRMQGRSLGITLSYVDMDLVVTSAPCEAEQGILASDSVTAGETVEEASDWLPTKSWVAPGNRWKQGAWRLMEQAKKDAEWTLSPLLIPDREAKIWEPTHPLEQIRWTWAKNRACNSHYVNVVKALKWWRREKHPEPECPKSYPLEHFIGQCCPDGITSVAAGVTLTLETIAEEYTWYAQLKQTPVMPDHGVLEHDVLARVTGEDFAAFHAQAVDAARLARAALDEENASRSAALWYELFGGEFPVPSNGGGSGLSGLGGFTPRTENSRITGGRFGRFA